MPVSAYVQKLSAPSLPEAIIKWQGPKSYTRVTAGTPATGGDEIPSKLLGIAQILNLEAQGSYTGNFNVIPFRISSTIWGLRWISLVTATVGGQAQTAGTEAASTTDLSAEYLHLFVKSAAMYVLVRWGLGAGRFGVPALSGLG